MYSAKSFSYITFIISICLSIQSLNAQAIFTWKSNAKERQAPYRNFHIIGFNDSELDDQELEDWFKKEIKENFNYVKDILTISADTNTNFQYETWIRESKLKTSDVIMTYSVKSEKIKKKKKKTTYNPIIDEPYYMSLRGYLTQKSKNLHVDTYEDDIWSVDIKIYHPVTYNLLYSANSQYFRSKSPKKKVQQYLEKMIQKAIREDVINDEMH